MHMKDFTWWICAHKCLISLLERWFSLCGLEACPVCQLKTSHVLAFTNRSRATGMDCTPLVNTPYLTSGTAHAIVGLQCKEDRNGSKLSKETPQLRALGWSSLHGCLLIYKEVTMKTEQVWAAQGENRRQWWHIEIGRFQLDIRKYFSFGITSHWKW